MSAQQAPPIEQELERLRAENARLQASLDASDERLGMFRQLLMQSPVAISVIRGPEHRFELANPRYLEMVGKTELIGMTMAAAFPEVAGTPLMGLFDRVIQTGEPFATDEYETALDRRGALEACFFRFNLVPIREAGQITGMMCTAVEITELVRARRAGVESAERLRLALDAGQLGDWEIDLRSGVSNRSL